MYADRFHQPRIQPASLGAALALSGVMVLGMVYIAPKVGLAPPPPDSIHVIPIHEVPPPPPVEPPRPHPKLEKPAPTEPVPAPKPIVDPPVNANTIATTTELPPLPPPGPIGTTPGGEGTAAKPIDPPLPALIDATADPRYAGDFQPPYPAAKQRANEEGRVTVRVLIGVDGRVKAFEGVRGDSAFIEATRRQALSRWRFRPATRGGVPVESWKTMTVRFELQG
jgi:periplasmic protein TonB